MVLQALRQMHTFEGISDDDLLKLLPAAKEIVAAADDILFNEGDPPSGLYVLLEGRLEISKMIGGRSVVLEQYQPGVFVGEISILTGQPHMATGRAMTASRYLKFEPSLFADLHSSPVARLLLTTMYYRVRDTESTLQQNDKLTALGRLSAGLAHELNNPAAASLRAAKQLPETLANVQSLLLNFTQLQLTADQITFITHLLSELAERAQAAPLSPLEQSDLEETISQWVDDQGFDNGWELAPGLAQGRVRLEELDALKATVGADALDEALVWLDGMLNLHSLLTTLEGSTLRISDMIRAVTAYTALDESPLQEVDLRERLENTLALFRHELGNMTVIREYDPALPRVVVYASELDQVWANLIDNAIDATTGRGRLRVRTLRDGDCALVEIADDGVGIPPDMMPRIFEPFFTTKAVGEGAGLGLDIAYRIVVNRHGGDIRVTSSPGDTRFRVTLPLGEPLGEP